MQDVWVKIDAVRPADGLSNCVNCCLGECRVVVDCYKDPREPAFEVQFSH